MRRIGMLLTVATLMAVMLVAMAMPAFAAKGGFGKYTVTGQCDEEGTSFDCTVTQAGKQGNAAGGPGRSEVTVTDEEPGDPAPFVSGTSSGGCGNPCGAPKFDGGGGRCTFEFSFSHTGGLFYEADGQGNNPPCLDVDA